MAELQPTNIHMLKLSVPQQNGTAFGDRAYQEVIKLKQGCKTKPYSNITAVFERRD